MSTKHLTRCDVGSLLAVTLGDVAADTAGNISSKDVSEYFPYNTTDSHYILLVLAPFAQYTRPESFYDGDNALESLEFNDKLHFHLPSHPNKYRQEKFLADDIKLQNNFPLSYCVSSK